MKTPVITLLTNDQNVEECVAQVVSETGGLTYLAQSVDEVLDRTRAIGEGRDLAVIDCEHSPHGLTLVGTIGSRREAFPVIVLTGPGDKQIGALAYANGAAVCLPKPVSAAQLTAAIEQCCRSQPDIAVVA